MPFAAGFAFIFLGERMNWLQALGALAVVGGVALLATGGRFERRAAASQQAAPLRTPAMIQVIDKDEHP